MSSHDPSQPPPPLLSPRPVRAPRFSSKRLAPDQPPVADAPPGPKPGTRRPWRRAAGFLLPLALALLLLLPLLDWYDSQETGLDGHQLVGPRLAQGPVCLDVAADMSGSMRDHVQAREAAMRQLQTFAGRNLRPGDVFTVAEFAEEAGIAVAPTPITELAAGRTTGAYAAGNTLLLPALAELRDAHAGSGLPCAAETLIVITDAELKDPIAELAARFADSDYLRVYWAVPDPGWRLPWQQPGVSDDPALESVTVWEFADADDLSRHYGHAIAQLTGQELHRN
ncbi:vWA domain-containing protein [Salinactinospora qingdaonensis]|uniref:VWA domain-containing protein n=1 Tax=Salinactinospora qingdaonensis TaxID=702744 RepID=A0ABP7FET9_9ACTN